MAVERQAVSNGHDGNDDSNSDSSSDSGSGSETKRLDVGFHLQGRGPVTIRSGGTGITTTRTETMDFNFNVTKVDVLQTLYDINATVHHSTADLKEMLLNFILEESSADVPHHSYHIEDPGEWELTMSGPTETYLEASDVLDHLGGSPSDAWHFTKECANSILFDESATVAFVAVAQRDGMVDDCVAQDHIRTLLTDSMKAKIASEHERESESENGNGNNHQ